MRPPPLGVTVSGKRPSEALATEAQSCAERWGLPEVRRGRKQSLAELVGTAAQALVVFGGDGVRLHDPLGAVRFHPGLAKLRIQAHRAGTQEEPLARLAGLCPGQRVLDCTLGLAQDAQVAAALVGPDGCVLGVERSLALAVLADAGLRRASPSGSARIEVRHADAWEVLAATPSGAFDVVLLDPMFARPGKAQPSFELLRRHAHRAPLSPRILSEARRVARRVVLVKGSRHSRDLRSLGLQPEPASRAASVVWARVPGEGRAP